MSTELTGAPEPDSPYKGLASFDDSDADALLFFGREADTHIVVANVLAARLTILYGPSGVGKSSLLRAGVVRELRDLQSSQPVAVAHFAAWATDIRTGIEAAARTAIADALGGDPGNVEGSLADRLDAWTAALGGELCLVLDQVEEAFLYRRHAALEALLPELVTRPGLRVNVVLGVREDALARLDAFKVHVPGLFANTLRLDHLDRESARSAILGPVDRWNERVATQDPIVVEPSLVDAVLDEVATGEDAASFDHADRGTGGRVDTTYLQLVLQRLWDVAREQRSNRLDRETLAGLGGAERIVEAHLERALDGLDESQRDAAAAMFQHLVTPSGTKIAHRTSDLAAFANAAPAELEPLFHALARKRILRPLREGAGAEGHELHEIYHDVLGRPIVAWSLRHQADRAVEAERASARRRHRRLAALAVGALIAVVLLGVLTAWALAQRRSARAEARTAQSRELAANALTQLSVDPELALALAVKGAETEAGPLVESALRETLLESRLRRVIHFARPIRALGVDGHNVVVATAGSLVLLDEGLRPVRRFKAPGRLLGVQAGNALLLTAAGLELRSLQTGRVVQRVALHAGETVPQRDLNSGVVIGRLRIPRRLRFVALGPRGTLVAVSDGGREIVLLNAKTGDARYRLEQPSAVTALAWGPGARTLVSGGRDGAGRIWNIRNGIQRATLLGHRGPIRAIAFSPRATLVATASADGTARVWAVSDGRRAAILAGQASPLLDVSFSPDGRSVATASEDGAARVWKAESGEPLVTLRASAAGVIAVRFNSHSDRLIGAGEDRTVREWDAQTQKQLTLLADLSQPIESAALVPHGIVAVTADGKSHLVSFRGANGGIVPPHDVRVVRSTTGSMATVHGKVVDIKTRDGRHIRLSGHTASVTSVHFSPNGKTAVTASRDRTVRLWSADTGAELRVLHGHFGIVRDAEFSPDGRWIVTAGPTGALWETETGRRLFYLRGHRSSLTFASFDASGARIFTASLDGTVRTYRCDVCESGAALLANARHRLRETGRNLTSAERTRYLGG